MKTLVELQEPLHRESTDLLQQVIEENRNEPDEDFAVRRVLVAVADGPPEWEEKP